jgi:tripartite-type tricarboxylate transporter receptor subunit TctC
MRKLLKTIVAAGLTAGSLGGAHAQSAAWPNKAVHLNVAFAPGGPVDIIARIIGPKLTETLGQPMVIDNRPGAGGNVGTTYVAKSAPDGYNVLVTSSAYAVNVSLFNNPGYDPDRDLIPQVLISMATVTVCEMLGLMVYAAGSDALARRFQSPTFAHWFFRIAALAMVISAAFAVYLTWIATGH